MKIKILIFLVLFLKKALLHRTDFFPGLGWLLTKTIWNEIKDNWPPGYMKISFNN
jgi:hypothetical protein